MSKNVTLQDKNGVQLFPATTAEQTSFDGSINVKQAIQRIQGSPLVAATASAMTDTSRVYVYTGSESGYTNGNWYYYNGSSWTSGGVYNAVAVQTDTTLTLSGVPADAKATGDRFSDFENIIGVSEIAFTDGGYITTGRSIGQTVNISSVTSASWYQYAVVDCEGGDEFLVSGIAGSSPRLWCFLDSSNAVLANSAADANATYLYITAPNGSKKLVLNRNISATVPPCYAGFATAKKINNTIDFIEKSEDMYVCNLLDTSKTIDGGYYNRNDVWVSNSAIYSTDYIPCKAGETFSLNYAQDIPIYDVNKSLIGYTGANVGKTRASFTVPASLSACYFRAYGTIAQKATDAIFKSSLYLGNSVSFPYGQKYVINSKTRDKLIYTFGDSRTWYDLQTYVAATTSAGSTCIGYQTWMRRFLSAAVNNYGVSGYTTPQILSTVRNTSLANADIITLAGGINDFLHSVSVGSIGSIGGTFDETTTYGATQAMIEYVLNNKPDAKLMLINPFTGWINNDADQYSNTYADVKRNLAELYGLPLLDLTKCAGFNALNRSTYYCDDMSKVSYRLHLNDAGNKVIGQEISAFVSNGY
jgi:lysophospholipase L1-like esterase